MTAAAKWFKVKNKSNKCNISRIYSMTSFDIPDVKWVERIIVGSVNPDQLLHQSEIDKQLDHVNRALRYGKLIGVEQNISTIHIEGKDIITQYMVYHVGFKHKPHGRK